MNSSKRTGSLSKPSWRRLVASAVLMLATSSGLTACSPTLNKAATDIGTVSAGITLPALPDDCRIQEPHAPLGEGTEVRTALKAERRQLDRANARVDRCATNYDNVKAALK